MQARQVELVIRRPGHPERRMVLEQGRMVIGRADDADIVLPDVGVSRRHARIVVDGGGIVVEDTGSGNGTWYRGKRIQRQVVGEGDEVLIDPFTLAFRAAAHEAGADISNGRDATVRMGGAAAVGARLVLVSEHAHKGQTWTLPDTGVVTLGRSDRNDVVLVEPGASRVHAEIGNSAGTWWVRDRGSANGTWVNKERVESRVLEDGDVIRIGTAELRFSRPQAAGEDGGERTEAFDGVMFTDFEGRRPGAARTPPPPPPVLAPVAPPTLAPVAAPTPAPPVLQPPRPPVASAPQARVPAPTPQAPPRTPVAPVPVGGIPIDRPASPPPRPPEPPRAGPSPLFLVPLVLVAVLAMFGSAILCAGWIGWQVYRHQAAPVPEAPAATPTSAAAPAPASPTPSSSADPRVDALLAEGRALFDQDRMFDAAAKFYEVLKIDPKNAEAERLAFVACELIAVDRMRDDLRAKTAPPPATNLAAAPAPAPAAHAPAPRAHADPAALVAKGQAAYDAGDYPGAVKAWQQAMSADPGRGAAWYDAEAGIRRAKDRMREAARPHYAVGLEAQQQGDLLTAREAFKEAVRLDPYNETAAARLQEIEQELSRQGRR